MNSRDHPTPVACGASEAAKRAPPAEPTTAHGQHPQDGRVGDGGKPDKPACSAKGDPGVKRQTVRRRRTSLPKTATSQLKAWLLDHVGHPYPTEAEKVEMATLHRLTVNQISNWFINARRRILPKYFLQNPISAQQHRKRKASGPVQWATNHMAGLPLAGPAFPVGPQPIALPIKKRRLEQWTPQLAAAELLGATTAGALQHARVGPANGSPPHSGPGGLAGSTAAVSGAPASLAPMSTAAASLMLSYGLLPGWPSPFGAMPTTMLMGGCPPGWTGAPGWPAGAAPAPVSTMAAASHEPILAPKPAAAM